MKIIAANNWNQKMFPLEKFLTEKILQRCDYQESLSNQHRTTNGYRQLKELLDFAIISRYKIRTLKSLKVFLEEARSSHFKQSIVNDIIIGKYFTDLKSYIREFKSSVFDIDTKKPDLTILDVFIHKLKIFENQLSKRYYTALRSEIINIDYSSDTEFARKSENLSNLIDLLIPYLVFNGYAVSSIAEVLYTWVKKDYRITARRILWYFGFKKKTFNFLIDIGTEYSADFKIFVDLLTKDQNVDVRVDTVEVLNKDELNIDFIDSTHYIVLYSSAALDPHIHARTIYDNILKKVVQTRERQSLASFNNFFDSCYWRVIKKGKNFHKVELVNDPINVNYRSHTLRDTLIKSAVDFDYSFSSEDGIPIPENKQLNNALYYYNLALGSKSIENSLSLLWTSLEALIPYRLFYSDIECVQHFVSKSLSLGAISRDIYAFANRFQEVNYINNNCLNSVGNIQLVGDGNGSQSKFIQQWYDWILAQEDHEKKFQVIKANSELLAFEYFRIGHPMANDSLKVLKDRIMRSSDSIRHQLQRIYLHRNQIIHSGNLVNEYTNLWMHLEWYIGKLLSYSIINIEILKWHDSLESVFIQLEADYDYVTSYLEKNKAKRFEEMTNRIKKIVLNYSWQSY